MNAMFRAAIMPSSFANRCSHVKRSYSSTKNNIKDIRTYLAFGRFQAGRADWEGVKGQAACFAHHHESIDELEQNKKIMTWVMDRLDYKAERLITDATIFHLGIDAIDFQLALRRSGATIITLSDFSKAKTEK
jgi:hypothetical protein